MRWNLSRKGYNAPARPRAASYPRLVFTASVTPKELKRHLTDAGFQVFRTVGTRLVLADRVRDNLILDSGVSVDAEEPHRVRFAVRTQARDYPAEASEALTARARAVGAASLSAGYAEVGVEIIPVHDPGDADKVLDTRYEVAFEKGGLSVEQVIVELRYAMGFIRAA